MDNPPKSLAAAEARIASKDAQLIEIEIELDRRKTSIEDLERKHWKLEQELERVLLLLPDAEKHGAKYVRQTTNLELQLAQASLFVRDVKADESSFKSEGLQQPTHSNKLEKTELRV
jgi:septal ring factor EnvC (AmiA/AmiB activator)